MMKLDLAKVVEKFDERFDRCNKENEGKGVTILQIAETIWGGFPAVDALGAYDDLRFEAPQIDSVIPKEGKCPMFNKDMTMLLTLFHANGHAVEPLRKMLPTAPEALN